MTDVTTGLRTFRDGRLIVNSLDSVHASAHAGNFYSGGYYSSSVADTAALRLLVQATRSFHAEFTAVATGDCTLALYVGTTFSAAGTSVPMSNHSLDSTNTSPVTVTHTPTITADGTQFNGIELLPGGAKHSAGGGEAGFGNEVLIPSGYVMMFVVTNVSGGAVKMSLSVDGYED